MQDDFEVVIGHDGKPTRILKDGGRLRVSMSMRDAALRDQRRGRRVKYDPQGRLLSWEEEEMDDARERRRSSTLRGRGFLHDGHGNTDAVGHKPGFLVRADIAHEQRHQAHADYIRDLESAYKNPPTGFGGKGARGPQVGDLCTVRGPEFPESFGASGHLQMRGGDLVCAPDAKWRGNEQPDAASDKRSVADAYRDYDDELRNAWRNPK
jgi:hypothetical protein